MADTWSLPGHAQRGTFILLDTLRLSDAAITGHNLCSSLYHLTLLVMNSKVSTEIGYLDICGRQLSRCYHRKATCH